MIETAPITEKAVLVGLISSSQDEKQAGEYLDELEFLADTAGAIVLKKFTQKLDTPNTATFVGSGKLDEIGTYI
ncbi:MAG TPA: GTPase HflX, partial [Draconibacterium sp.]|nr:GTPase HflX [Draconibacterium sp.]